MGGDLNSTHMLTPCVLLHTSSMVELIDYLSLSYDHPCQPLSYLQLAQTPLSLCREVFVSMCAPPPPFPVWDSSVLCSSMKSYPLKLIQSHLCHFPHLH